MWGSFGQYDFISEGDSPAFLHLVDVGLGNLENPHFGGWGGRLIQSSQQPNRWEDGEKAADFNPYKDSLDLAYAQARWVPAIQEDFAARADWCIKPFKEANHAPKISVKEGNLLKVKAGNKITLTAAATDPDGNKVNIAFWQYVEAGTSPEKALIIPKGIKAEVQVPTTAKSGDTIHVIVEGKDDGSPAITRYQRVILTVD